MVKLDVTLLRFMEPEDFRVLTALEMAMRNHDVAPTALIERIAQLPHGGCKKRLAELLRRKMIHHENTAYDGYAMKYVAYDFLALRTFSKRGTVTGVGSRIGCGKESDIILVQDENHQDCVLKLQRLGRCSFRTVTRNRDYKGGKTRRGESWFYLSRLAAQKEFAFMKMLYNEGFPVPKPIDQNRHAVVMELVKGTLLNHIQEMDQAQKVYERALNLMVKLAEHGLIHGDFNEFNLLVTDDYRIVMIDFPQMISTDHKNAAELFDRDVTNLANFFSRRFRVETLLYPKLQVDVERTATLDRVAFASGFFTKKQQQELEAMLQDDDNAGSDDDEEEESDASSSEAGGAVEAASKEKPEEKPAPEERSVAKKARHIDTTKVVELPQQQEGDKSDADDDDTTDPEGSESKSSGEGEEERDEDDDTVSGKPDASFPFRRDAQSNPNLKPNGEVNHEYIKKRVKGLVKRADDREFHRTMHRNAQKGRAKRRIQRELKSGRDFSLFD